MRAYNKNRKIFRNTFILTAMLIVVASLIYSHFLVSDLSKEEHNKMQIWAEATKEAINADENTNLNLIARILESNTTIPIIQYDKEGDIYTSVNIDLPTDDQSFLKKKAEAFEKKHDPIFISSDHFEQYLYYDDSHTLKRLQWYPYIQIAILSLFFIVSLLVLISTKRMEQDRLWVGLSKETAHQLGTPLSSLIAWTEYLKLKNVDEQITTNMELDISRLQEVTDRFSKIGSTPTLERIDICQLTLDSINYLENRISKKVVFEKNIPSQAIYCNASSVLVSWVIENLTKNAIDAMSGIGTIRFDIIEKDNSVILDISDTGKGLSKSQYSTIFNTGFTTKERGWGLGLSLARRIIQEYHKGKIFVSKSQINVGTTIRIELQKM